MKHIYHIAAIIALVIVSSCAKDEFNQYINYPASIGDAVTIVGRMTRFDDKDVTTKDVKNDDEAKLTSMALAIFPVNNDGTGLAGNCVYYQYSANQQELLFTIERGLNYSYNARYAMYVFTNMPGMDKFGIGSTLEQMMQEAYSVENLNIPENGFPMMGSLGDTFSNTFDKDNQAFILSPLDANNHLIAPTVDGTTKNLLTIAMKAMYAKINFTIKVTADQQIDGNYSPQFRMSGYAVNNVPSKVDFSNTTNSDALVLTGGYSLPLNGNTEASGAKTIKFSFYLPERLLTPATSAESYEYPFGTGYSNLREEDKKYAQRFKSKLLGNDQKATNIVISGTFRDHQNLYWDVNYTIYLGENNYSDFNIKRNSEYNNYITIRGLQSSSDMSNEASPISIDHRVNVERTQPAIISLRRETLLDSHFEIRPLRIRKSNVENIDNINAIKVEVVNPSITNWMRIERSFGDGISNNDPTNSKGESIYINETNDVSYGKRRYFTTNLVTGSPNATDATLKDNTEVIVPITENDDCVWLYVDECTETGDGVRAGIIRITYGNLNGSEFTPTTNSAFPVVNYTINQRKLFKVTYDENNDNTLSDSERSYYVEYEEEYLHNFDANDDYGSTEFAGMKWGLEGVQLSHSNQALLFDADVDIITNIINNITNNSGVKPVYDFYIKSHDRSAVSGNPTMYDYNGYNFSNNIISFVNQGAGGTADEDDKITTLALNQQPKSAIEYCYNKNKRDNNGNVTTVNWYLPSVDEIEEIVTSKYVDPENVVNPTYARFKEFQEQYYWSSQPAYIRNRARYAGWLFQSNGAYFYDDINRARSTSVVYDNGTYIPSPSGVTGYDEGLLIEVTWFGASTSYEYFREAGQVLGGETLKTMVRQSGNKARNDKARIRCVRKVN